MTDLNFKLHPRQLEIFNSTARFKAVLAGRRAGKSFLATVLMLIEGLRAKNNLGYDLSNKGVYYVTGTQQQARDVMWSQLKDMGREVISAAHENTMIATLVNGRKIHLKGADRPETLRGVGLSYVVFDEYADIKSEVWEQIVRPTLSDVEGGGLFIGTPKPIGLCQLTALCDYVVGDPDWATFHFASIQNPFLNPVEIEAARRSMSAETFMQEFEAIGQNLTSAIFKSEEIVVVEEEPDDIWSYVLSVDLAGFGDAEGQKRLSAKFRRTDETAIACVGAHRGGWYVDDIIHGRWGVRETALKILRACQKYRPRAVGFERGALKNAVLPYMQDYMRRLGVYPTVVDLSHGGKHKVDRVTWALQGRMQNKRVQFRNRAYLKPLTTQLLQFGNPMVPDDLVDALSYADQMVAFSMTSDYNEQEVWTPMDALAGY